MLSMKTVDRPSFFASQIHLMDRHLSKIAKELKRGLSKRNTLQGTGMYSVSWSYNRGGSRIFEGGGYYRSTSKTKKSVGARRRSNVKKPVMYNLSYLSYNKYMYLNGDFIARPIDMSPISYLFLFYFLMYI